MSTSATPQSDAPAIGNESALEADAHGFGGGVEEVTGHGAGHATILGHHHAAVETINAELRHGSRQRAVELHVGGGIADVDQRGIGGETARRERAARASVER